MLFFVLARVELLDLASVQPSGRRGWERALAWGGFHVGDRNPGGTKMRPNAESLSYCDEKTGNDRIRGGWAEKK